MALSSDAGIAVISGQNDASGVGAAWAFAFVPGAPTGVSASGSDGAATVSWAAPAADGSPAVTGYTATASPGGRTCTTSGALSCTVTCLTNGTGYRSR